MKTIQEVIREMDPEKIIDAYWYEHPIEIGGHAEELPDDITTGELKDRRLKTLLGFIQSLLEVTPKPYDGRKAVLFVSKTLWGDEKELLCVHADEVLKAESFDEESVPSYSYIYSDREDVMSFLVADNKLTQDNLDFVVVKFLWEVSFFGYDEEGLKKAQKRIEEACREIGKAKPISLEEWDKEFNVEEYPQEDDLRKKYYEAQRAYDDYCREVELQRIKESLLREHTDVSKRIGIGKGFDVDENNSGSTSGT
ncbi:MAG: hypothetical protein IJ821_06210 [Lachnospiraceae bacterium]|nr:hypothetical protein [Lachnospiraceae bacterium]